METKFQSRRQRIDTQIDAQLIDQMTELLKPFGPHYRRTLDCYYVISEGLPDGLVKLEDYHWDKLLPQDQELMSEYLGRLAPLLGVLKKLTRSRQKRINEQVKTNLRGGGNK